MVGLLVFAVLLEAVHPDYQVVYRGREGVALRIVLGYRGPDPGHQLRHGLNYLADLAYPLDERLSCYRVLRHRLGEVGFEVGIATKQGRI